MPSTPPKKNENLSIEISTKNWLCLFFFFAITIVSYAQDGFVTNQGTTISCGHDDHQEDQIQNLRGYKEQHLNFEQGLRQQIQKINGLRQENIRNGLNPNDGIKDFLTSPCQTGGTSNVYVVPVVVHVVHSSTEPNPGDGDSNPTDAQIIQGIQDLNDAFRNIGAYAGDGHNAHAAVKSVDVEIEFRIAQRDINNSTTHFPGASGITRHSNNTYTDLNSDSEDPAMQEWVQGASQLNGAFPSTDYINIYLVEEICSPSSSSGCGVAGYADFPGSHGTVGNCIVNEARFFGSSTNNSKVHIHEVGHYFSLHHTWKNGCTNNDCTTDGDQVCDTPPDNSTTSVTCGNAANTCTTDTDDTSSNNPFTTDQDDLYENYMDYSYQSCQNTFTAGQKDRMRYALSGQRTSLLFSQGAVPLNAVEVGITGVNSPSEFVCSDVITPVVTIKNFGTSSITSLAILVEVGGVAQYTKTWSGAIPSNTSAPITLDPLTLTGFGTHNLYFEITDVNGVGSDSYNENDAFCLPTKYSSSVSSLPYCEDIEAGINADWVIQNPDNTIQFEERTVSGCASNNSKAIGLITWAQFPDENTTDAIFTQEIETGAYADATLQFDVAYSAYYGNFQTVLDIAVSTDCGLTWNSVYNKTGSQLATTTYNDGSGNISISDPAYNFIPTSCTDWRSETVDLTAYTGNELVVRFQASAYPGGNANGDYWGNNLYLDNICLDGTQCTPFTTNTSSPQAVCDMVSLSADGSTVGTNQIMGWWLTKDAAITASVSNQASLNAALATATEEGTLTSEANQIYLTDGGAPLTLNFDCATLMSGATYYATPFISDTTAAIAAGNCTITDEDLSVSGFSTFNGNPSGIARITASEITCSNASIPTYTLSITIGNYTGNTADHKIFIRAGASGNTLVWATLSGNGTYNFTNTSFQGYNPTIDDDGFKIWSYEDGGSGMTGASISATLTINYAGVPAVNFPTVSLYNDCVFGDPVAITCACACPEDLVVSPPIMDNTTYEATNTITSTATIPATYQVTFIAPQGVRLQSGFHSPSTAIFNAKSGGGSCNTTLENTEEVATARNSSSDNALIDATTTPTVNTNLNIQIQPNPAQTSVEIKYSLATASATSISLYNLTGKQVKIILPQQQQTKGQHQQQVDVSNLKAGIYFVLLENEGQVLSEKLVVIKN